MLKYSDFIEALESVPDKEKPEFIKRELRSKSRLHIFGKYFFPLIIKGNYVTPDCHLDLINQLSSDNDSGIIFPRGFAKSTWEKIDTIHDIVYCLEPVILYVSNTITDAQFHFESIKTELENNQILIAIYSDLVPEFKQIDRKWTNKHFETTNGVNVVAKGACKGRGVNIKNQRPTKIIIDDAEDDEMVKSHDRRLKYHYWLNNVIIPSKDPNRGKIKIIGTVIHNQCEVLKYYKEQGGIFRKAIEKGKSIWPQMFPIERLLVIKDGGIDPITRKKVKGIGTRSFNQEFLNTPITGEIQRIKPEWLEASTYSKLDQTDMKKVLMLDPQAGETKSADYYGLVKGGKYIGDKHRYILSVRTGRCSQLNQAALFIRTWLEDRKDIYIAGIEKILSQVAVYQYVLDWKNFNMDFQNENADLNINDRNIPLAAITPCGKDKVARLEMHEASIERGEVHLHHTMSKFAERLAIFPELDHDDDLDAFIYVLEYLNKRNLSSSDKECDNDDKAKTVFGNIRNKQF